MCDIRETEAMMVRQRSRAYKLQLSKEGIQLLVRCHARLCRLATDLLPYGATLFVAVELLRDYPAKDVAAELLDPALQQFGGRNVRHVGTSPILSDVAESITAQVCREEALYPPPQLWKVFLVALVHMEDVEDQAVIRALHRTTEMTGRPTRRATH
jgi:hypothetical protein